MCHAQFGIIVNFRDHNYGRSRREEDEVLVRDLVGTPVRNIQGKGNAVFDFFPEGCVGHVEK